jgi:hypothetical protein
MLQRSLRANSDPAREYVVMPPASLSTLDVIMPGPIRMKKSPMVRHRECLELENHLL